MQARNVKKRSTTVPDILLRETKKMKHDTTKASAATELCVSLFIIAALAVGIALVANDVLTIGKMIIGVVAVFGSFGPVIAISALPGNLTQTFASGDRVLNLLAEKSAVTPVQNGEKIAYNDLKVTGSVLFLRRTDAGAFRYLYARWEG